MIPYGESFRSKEQLGIPTISSITNAGFEQASRRIGMRREKEQSLGGKIIGNIKNEAISYAQTAREV